MENTALTACPACGGTSLSMIATWRDWETACENRPDGPMRLAAARECGVADIAPTLVQCGTCASVAMDPMPTSAQVGRFYENYHATDDFVAKADKKVFRALKRLLPFRLTGGGRFLEVGASIGTAAEAARRLGFDAIAQEIDGEAVAQGQTLFPKIKFVHGFLDDVPAEPAFDMIYCAEVVEHVPAPDSFARELFERLRPGGRLFLTTPDAGHSKRPEPFISWKSVKPPEHIVLFTKAGLKSLFEGAGFSSPRFLPHPKPGIRMIARRPR